ncbi:MAG: hypothetical protein OXU61_06725 [Gammaproteobacteria bacterium]|nr:hypothetical protein [Gammaproteobacteria bacterium]
MPPAAHGGRAGRPSSAMVGARYRRGRSDHWGRCMGLWLRASIKMRMVQ